MATIMWNLSSLLLISVLTIGEVSAVCDVNTLDSCLAGFQSWSMTFNLALVDVNNISAACKAFSDTQKCVSVNATCADFEAPTLSKWVGQKNALTYICSSTGTGQQDYLKSQRCLSRADVMTSIVSCDRPAQNTRPDAVCSSLNNKLSCISNVARSLCGNETAQFINKINPGMYAPQVSVSAPGCTGLCNSAALDACLAKFQTYSTSFATGAINAANIDAACSSYAETVDCVLNKAMCTDWDPMTMIKWTGTKSAIGYCCKEGKSEYLRNQMCMASQSFLAALDVCLTPIDPFTQGEAACTLYNDQLRCISSVSKSLCGDGVAQFMNKIAPGLTGPAFMVQAPQSNCVIPGMCNAAAVRECLVGFDLVGGGITAGLTNSADLSAACSTYSVVSDCIRRKAMCQDSDPIVRGLWAGTKNVVASVCGDGRADYLKNQQCLSKISSNGVLNPCWEQMPSTYNSSDIVCQSFSSTVECITGQGRKTCGDDSSGVAYAAGVVTAQMRGPLSNMSPGCTGACSFPALDACLKTFQPFADGFFFANLDASNITAACKAYATATTCVLNKANCSDSDPITQMNWIGIKNIAAYTCGEGRTAYLANQKCLASSALMNALYACVKPALPNVSAEGACKAINEQIACEVSASNTTCNANVSYFMRKNIIGYLGPQANMHYPNCIISGQCDKNVMEVCLARFDRYSQGFMYDSVDSSNITAACSAYTDAVNCVGTKAMCTDSDLIAMFRWTGVKNTIGYICAEGRNEYLNSQKCLYNAKFGKMAPVSCLKPIDVNLSPDGVCKELNNQTQCFITLAKSTCGDVAAKFISRIAPGLLGPQWMNQYPACTLISSVSPPVVKSSSGSRFLNVYLSVAAVITASAAAALH